MQKAALDGALTRDTLPAAWAVGTVVTAVHLLALLVALVAFFLLVDIRTDLATGWVDSAIYHALFLDVDAIQERYGDIYWLSRWPWILSGSAAFALLAPVAASLTLTLATSWVFAVACYGLMRQFVSPECRRPRRSRSRSSGHALRSAIAGPRPGPRP